MSAMSSSLYQLQQDPELRRLKEAFVSNLQGTSRWEVFCVLSSLPLCLLTAAYIEARVAARVRSSSYLRKPLQAWAVPKFVFEFGGAVLPLLLVLMSLAPAEPAFLLLFLLWGSLALKLWMRLAHGPAARQHMGHMLQHMTASRKRFVSAFRGGVMAATCIAILGVDFPAFPRRYAKAEGYGGGVMDVGVGAIIFAGGLVSAVAAAGASSSSSTTAAASGSSNGVAEGPAAAAPGATAGGSTAATPAASSKAVLRWLLQLLRGLRAAAPLLLLGGAREVATALVGYQAHLGEYGLHWNFFYTIAAVALLTLALPVPPRWLAPLGLAVTAAHQALLGLDISRLVPTPAAAAAAAQPHTLHASPAAPAAATLTSSSSSSNSPGSAAAAAGVSGPQSLSAWIHMELGAEARQAAGFVASNKEGLGSLPGYWGLYLLAAALAHHLGTSCVATAARARTQLFGGGGSGGSSSRPGGSAAAVAEAGRLVWAWVGAWWVVDLLLWAALAAVEAAVEPVSRRTCNLPYVLWTTAQCLAWLLLVLMADLLTSVICSTSSGCGTGVGGSGLHHLGPAGGAAGGHMSSSSKGHHHHHVRRSLELHAAAAAAAHASPRQEPAAPSCTSPLPPPQQQQQQHHQASAAGQHSPVHPSPRGAAGGGSAGGSGVQQRRSGGKRIGGSSPMAAAAAAAAALTAAAAVGGAGSSTAAVAAAATAAVMDSQQHSDSSGSSREGSPRKPPPGSKAAAAGPAVQGSPKQRGASSSPKRTPDSSGSPGGVHAAAAAGGGGSASSTPVRSRRPASRLQPQQQQHVLHQQHQQQQPPQRDQQHTGGSSSSSGGPMRLMLAFNRNMLPLFLLANLLTGAVNLCTNTLAVGSWAARLIVGLYMLVLCGVAVLLDKRGITLKPW